MNKKYNQRDRFFQHKEAFCTLGYDMDTDCITLQFDKYHRDLFEAIIQQMVYSMICADIDENIEEATLTLVHYDAVLSGYWDDLKQLLAEIAQDQDYTLIVKE